ncbi:MAG: PAS domain-containing protein, partial [Chitinophagaceae bacterium]
MTREWTVMKNIIQASERSGNIFLSLINEEGVITSTNAAMRKQLELSHPSTGKTNFFDLVHPAQLPGFKKLVTSANRSTDNDSIELYIKNGHYHPMKWHVNYLKERSGNKKTYLCLGYNILDQERRKKFNSLVKQNYQLLIENQSGIIFHDKNGDIVATNQKTASIFNTSLESLYRLKDIGSVWNSTWVVTDEAKQHLSFSNAPFIKALRTGKPQKETLKIVLRNGEEKWILVNSQPLPEKETGGDFSVVSSIVDVTNETNLARKLKEKETIIHSFLQQTTQLAWVVDEESHLHFASEAFYKHFCTTEEECTSKRITEIIPDKILQSILDIHREVLTTGKRVETTQRIKWADGHDLISYISLFPLGTIGGKKAIGGQAIHLPDSSELEKKLHQAHERMINLNRAISDAIWEWDMQTGHMQQNEILLEMTGYQPDHSKGLSWWLRQIHPSDRSRISDKVKDA